MMHADTVDTAPPIATSPLLRRTWHALRDAWNARRRRAQDLRLLSEMNARDLNDLGLGRGEIERITAMPLHERWHR